MEELLELIRQANHWHLFRSRVTRQQASRLRAEEQLWFRDGPDLVWQDVPDSGALFDPATGETHFLSELPEVMLCVIDRTPASYSSLVERLGGPNGLDKQAELKIVAALRFLEGAELIESTTFVME